MVTLSELSIQVTNLPFSWLPRIGLPGMTVSLRASAVLEISMLHMEFNDICISQLCFDLLVTPTVAKKLQTNVMLSYKLIASCVFFKSVYLLSKKLYIYIYI